MKKVARVSQVRLPMIKTIKNSTHAASARSQDFNLHDSYQEENQRNQIQQLEHWTARYRQTNKKTNSRLLKNVFRNSSKKGYKSSEYRQSSLLTEAKMYLLRLDNELKKVYEINYSSMYKNPQYCSGVYEHFYGDILKQIQKLTNALLQRYQQVQTCIEKKRSDHIKSMETMNSYKLRITAVRQSIEDKELQLEPLKSTIDSLEKAKVVVLKHCLALGYDVRQNGLIWILRKLEFVPDVEEFPSFLTEKQVNFIKLRYQIEQKERRKSELLQTDEEGKTFGKTSDEIYEIVTRKKKRQLSMVRQGEILNQIRDIHNMNYRPQRHRYIDQQILKMAEESFPKTKHTKYQIIYKQTVKKLNKYCVNQIYKKNNKKTKDIAESRKESLNTLKILSHFQAKIEDYLRKANSHKMLQSDEERQLDEIVRSLRYESYQEPSKIDRNSRNPVSILCCLVGHRKAKRIVEQELGHLL